MALVVHESSKSFDDRKCTVVVQNLVQKPSDRFVLSVPLSSSCAIFHSLVSEKVRYMVGTFDLIHIVTDTTNDTHISMNINRKDSNQSLEALGFSSDHKNYVDIKEKPDQVVEMLCPAAEPENEDVEQSLPEPPPYSPDIQSIDNSTSPRRLGVLPNDLKSDITNLKNGPSHSTDLASFQMPKLVGLVNQAMTCYLNSLIQTLFMTPEFRNALYRWEPDFSGDTSTSIPYQLQHLFLQLQTSDKQSVETTGLTRSFGWDSSEAWQQHDIQELCRVMFDALEKKFEGTDQADLIKHLYEGKMKDYVQCCECSHESARDDTFLDVPITIRPFGSNKTYKSVLEGLNAFVEPETLDDTNQYYCEKCDKKCDAKKGLKFIKFPYLLTLQLKRFDFDYSTMHRIKLNDRMSFPEILNLNSFTDDSESSPSSRNSVCEDSMVDEDTSSHDSGHDFEQGSSSTANGSGEVFQCPQRNSSEEEEEDVERSSVDEGIDIEPQHSSHKRRKSNSTWWHNNETVKRYLKEGPFVYELFSVMVHSGSASGGHYYAYIKSFEDNRWYSFNDQIVSAITHQDIEKTFGGSPYSRSSTYYSSFSSSTNAYMLMYRQINETRNANYIKTEDLPSHIRNLLEREKEEERQLQMRNEIKKSLCSIQVFCRHHSALRDTRVIAEELFEFHKDISLEEAVKEAHRCLKLDREVVPLERCRLVKFDHINDVLDRSFDLDADDGSRSLSQLLGGVGTTYLFDLLLETREEREVFQRYEKGGVTIKVHVADHENMCFLDPFILRFVESDTVLRLKTGISERLGCPPERLLVAYEKYSGDCYLLQRQNNILKQEGFFRSAKVFVDIMTDDEYSRLNIPLPLDIQLENTFLFSVIDKIANVITVNIMLPPESDVEFSSKTSPKVPPGTSKSNDPNPTSPSSDEGVGSYGGSGNGDLSPYNNERQLSGACSPSANSITSSETGNSPKPTTEGNVPSSESCWFWKIPEIAGGKPVSPVPLHEGGEYHAERKRNNSYDDDQLSVPNLMDLQGKIQEKLEGYASPVSPTSSLKCEDSGSSHSGQNSFITDVDFEAEVAFTGDDSQPTSEPSGAVGSEAGSLSNSCSTLDSTDTLCNTAEPSENFINLNMLNVVPENSSKPIIESEGVAPDHPRPILTRSYPGRAVPCVTGFKPVEASTSDYNKALRYAEETSDNSVHFKDTLSGVAGTGDPSDCSGDQDSSGLLPSHNIANKIKNLSASQKITSLGESSSCPNDIPSSSQSCNSPSTVKQPRATTDKQSSGSQSNPSDPDSGEATDELKPLFSTEGTPSKISSVANHHFHPLPAYQTGEGRERTVSSSSLASDAWGTSPEVIYKHDFFKVLSTNTVTSAVSSNGTEPLLCKVLNVEIDKRMTLLCLKRHIAPFIGIHTKRFCVYRHYPGSQETEVSSPTDDFRLVTDGSRFIVRLGRALRKDEHRCKLFLLSLDEEETTKPLMSWVLSRGLTVEESKKMLVADLSEQCSINKKPDQFRLRKKTWRSPGQIYLPNEKFGTDISLYGSLEFFIEYLNEPEKKNKRSDLVVYTRRWFPSELRFNDFHEIVISEDDDAISYLGYSLNLLVESVAHMSGIPKEHVRVAKGKGVFPYRIGVFCVESELEWHPTQSRSHPFHLNEDGIVIFYKDNREEMKIVTDDERREIEKEEQKYDSTTTTIKYSSSSSLSSSIKPTYRRERALKIYTVDTGPSSSKSKQSTSGY